MLKVNNTWSERTQYPPNTRLSGLTHIQRRNSQEESSACILIDTPTMKRKVNRLESEKSRLLNTISDLRALLDRVVLEHRKKDTTKVENNVIIT